MTGKGFTAVVLAAAGLMEATICCAGAAALSNPFFAMDTATKDASHQTPESQARLLKEISYTGPIGFQGYGIKGDARDNLKRTMDAWKRLSQQAAR